MISEFFIGVGSTIWAWVLGMLPDLEWADGMVLDASNSVSSLLVAAGSISAWFPWPVAAFCIVGVLGSYVALFVVKIAKNLISHVPVIGGSG